MERFQSPTYTRVNPPRRLEALIPNLAQGTALVEQQWGALCSCLFWRLSCLPHPGTQWEFHWAQKLLWVTRLPPPVKKLRCSPDFECQCALPDRTCFRMIWSNRSECQLCWKQDPEIAQVIHSNARNFIRFCASWKINAQNSTRTQCLVGSLPGCTRIQTQEPWKWFLKKTKKTHVWSFQQDFKRSDAWPRPFSIDTTSKCSVLSPWPLGGTVIRQDAIVAWWPENYFLISSAKGESPAYFSPKQSKHLPSSAFCFMKVSPQPVRICS